MEKKYFDCCIHDRGFLHKKPQCSIISPTLTAEGHSPKVVELLSDDGGKIIA